MQRCCGLCDQSVQQRRAAGSRPGAEVQPVAGTPGVFAASQRDGGTLHPGAARSTEEERKALLRPHSASMSIVLLSLQMQQWFNVEGDHHLLEAESVNDSGDRMEQILNSFTAFLIEANVRLCVLVFHLCQCSCSVLCLSSRLNLFPLLLQDRRQHAMSLVSEAERLQASGPLYPETEAFRALVVTFKSGLEDFLCRAEASGRELQIMVNVCDFCEQVSVERCQYTALLIVFSSYRHL